MPYWLLSYAFEMSIGRQPTNAILYQVQQISATSKWVFLICYYNLYTTITWFNIWPIFGQFQITIATLPPNIMNLKEVGNIETKNTCIFLARNYIGTGRETNMTTNDLFCLVLLISQTDTGHLCCARMCKHHLVLMRSMHVYICVGMYVYVYVCNCVCVCVCLCS